MKINKISENQIRCTINTDELNSRNLKLSDLAYGNERAKSLFHDIMKAAEAEHNFKPDDAPLMIEAIPDNSQSITLVITKVSNEKELDEKFPQFKKDHNKNNHNSKNNEAKKKKKLEFIPRLFSFLTLDEVIVASQFLMPLYSSHNTLYKDEESDLYILALIPKPAARPQFKQVCSMLSEFGTQEDSTGITLAYLEEHCTVLLAKNAIQKLATMLDDKE